MLIRNYFLFILISLVIFNGCIEDETDPVLVLGAPSQITAPSNGTNFVITEDNLNDILAKFTWTEPDYGIKVGVNYTIEMDIAGNNFADPIQVGSTRAERELDISNERFNTALTVTKELADGVSHAVEVRIISEAGNEVTTLISDPITLNITPYAAEIIYPDLFVPGSYQGWDPASAPTIFSVGFDDNYEGFNFFGDNDTQFKLTDGPSWDLAYGTSDGTTLELGGIDNNLMAPEAGVYLISADIPNLTFSLTKTEWGVLGDATPGGWDVDQDLVYDAEKNTLSVNLDLSAGEIKFRANDDWAINLGDTGANGDLSFGGDNIVIGEAGNYNIELIIMNQAVYTYRLTKN